MGRHSADKNWTGKWKQDKGSKHWDYWHGSWSSAWDRKAANATSSGAGNGKEFPKYFEMAGGGEPAAKETEDGGLLEAADADMEPSHQGFLRALQKALNNSRKLEAKSRKMQIEKQKKIGLWREFESRLKATYFEQMKVFQEDMKRLDQEIENALKQKKDALQQVTDLAERGDVQVPEASAPATGASLEEEQSWQQLLQQKPECLSPGSDPWVDGILRSPCPRQAALSVLKEFKEAAENQDEILRNKLHALQNEVRALKEMPAVAESAAVAHVATPPRRPAHGLQMTPPPVTKEGLLVDEPPLRAWLEAPRVPVQRWRPGVRFRRSMWGTTPLLPAIHTWLRLG